MNQTQTDPYLIIVDDDDIQRHAFKRELEEQNVNAIITDSIIEACIQWMILTKQGKMPRAVIVDWHLRDDDAEIDDPRDGLTKRGAHYLLNQCCDCSDSGLLITYTGNPSVARDTLNKSTEGTRVHVVSKDQLDTKNLLDWALHHKAFAEH